MCHHQWVKIENTIDIRDEESIPLAFHMRTLVHRLAGASLVLCDSCMRYLNKKYTMSLPASDSLSITTAIVLYVMLSAPNSNGSHQLVFACPACGRMSKGKHWFGHGYMRRRRTKSTQARRSLNKDSRHFSSGLSCSIGEDGDVRVYTGRDQSKLGSQTGCNVGKLEVEGLHMDQEKV